MKRIFTAIITLSISYLSFGQDPGFFLGDHVAKDAVIPQSREAQKTSEQPSVMVVIDFNQKITPVSQYLFGNNANVYMTQVVDQPVLLNYLKKLSPNVIRFPGGNLSSVYFWNAEKNLPPGDAPPQLPDASGTLQPSGYWYGKNEESWTMSVENYYKMLEQTNSTGIITVNYGYARYSTADDPVGSAAHLAAEWVRYDKGRTKFWEIGNESNGTWQAGYRIKTSDNKDSQPEIITGELYGKHFKVFADSMRKAANEVGAEIFLGAQLLQEAPASWWNSTDRTWNSGVFQHAGDVPDYYVIHSYYTPYQTDSKAADILSSATKVTEGMMEFVVKSQKDAGVAVKPVALTEWNIFAEGSKQQVSFINGMHAAITLGELIKNKYGLAARWDLANGWSSGNDHGMFNQGDEPGNIPKWNPRPVYYYMYYFQKYFGDYMVDANVTGSTDVLAYASSFTSGQAGVVIVNKATSGRTVGVDLKNFGFGEKYYLYTLTGGSDNGEFSLKVNVNGSTPTYASGGPVDFENIPAQAFPIGDGVKVDTPARSVLYLLVENGDNVITSAEKDTNVNVQIFPNPTKGKLYAKIPLNSFSTVEIIDNTGRCLWREKIAKGQTEITLVPKLRRGLYVVRLSGAGGSVSKKISVD